MERVLLRASEELIKEFVEDIDKTTRYELIFMLPIPIESKIDKLTANIDVEIKTFKPFILTMEDLEERYWQHAQRAAALGDFAHYITYLTACERLQHKIVSFYDHVAKNGIVV